MLAFRHPLQLTNILRLVVKKSPTGESTHYFFFMFKVEVSCLSRASFGARVVQKTGKTPVLGRMLSKYVGRKTSSIENDTTKARNHLRQRGKSHASSFWD